MIDGLTTRFIDQSIDGCLVLAFSQALAKEESFEEIIRDLTQRLKDAETRASEGKLRRQMRGYEGESYRQMGGLEGELGRQMGG